MPWPRHAPGTLLLILLSLFCLEQLPWSPFFAALIALSLFFGNFLEKNFCLGNFFALDMPWEAPFSLFFALAFAMEIALEPFFGCLGYKGLDRDRHNLINVIIPLDFLINLLTLLSSNGSLIVINQVHNVQTRLVDVHPVFF